MKFILTYCLLLAIVFAQADTTTENKEPTDAADNSGATGDAAGDTKSETKPETKPVPIVPTVT